jgi:endonuclease/exonuclease/phosphatase family metal-dependent hydrolase
VPGLAFLQVAFAGFLCYEVRRILGNCLLFMKGERRGPSGDPTHAAMRKLRRLVNDHEIPGNGLRRKFHRGWLLLAMAGAAFIGSGAYRISGTPDQGTAFHGEVANRQTAPSRLRVATFNIHGGTGLDGVRDLQRTADCLQGLDLIGLNEVHGAWLGAEGDQAAALGRQLGLAWLFAPTERRWWCDHFGNALLTSLPVLSWQRMPLAGPPRASHRNVLLARLGYGERTIQVLATHVDRGRYRESQLRAVVHLFLALAPPAVLLGDLNSSEQEPLIQQLLTTPGVHDPVRDFLGAATPNRIDWIFTRGLRGTHAQVCANGASDHPCSIAELAITPD